MSSFPFLLWAVQLALIGTGIFFASLILANRLRTKFPDTKEDIRL